MVSNSLDQYQCSKEIVVNAANQLIELADARACPELGKRMQDQIEKLNRATFNLAVLGEFKRGKSTLINAFIHEPLLPVAVIPLTSVTTMISHSPITMVDVVFMDGSVQRIASSSLDKFVTESKNPANYKKVERVQITHPCAFLENGLCIIDTPGIGSAFEHNTRTAYDFLSQTDAAILLFSADQPATQVELAFLAEIMKHTPKVFLVQNKIDYLCPKDRQESLEYLGKTIEKNTGAPLDIYPVSARAALLQRTDDTGESLNNGVASLEKAILQFLLESKGQTLIETAVGRLNREINAQKQLIALEQLSRGLPQAELCQAMTAFTLAGEQIMQAQSDTEFIIRGETSRLLKEIEKHLQIFVEAHKEKLKEDMESCFIEHQNLSKSDLIKTLHKELFENLKEIFSNWRKTEDEEAGQAFAKITARFACQSNSIIDQIRKATLDHLGMEIAVHFEVAPLTTISKHRYAVDDPFTMAVESLPLLLPAALAKPIIRNRFQEAGERELNRNAGRLRADFQERIEKTTQIYLRQFQNQIENSLQEIALILKKVAMQERQTTEEIKFCHHNLQAQLETLVALENKISGARIT